MVVFKMNEDWDSSLVPNQIDYFFNLNRLAKKGVTSKGYGLLLQFGDGVRAEEYEFRLGLLTVPDFCQNLNSI